MRRIAASAVLSSFACAAAGAQQFSSADWLRDVVGPANPVKVAIETEAGAAKSDEITRYGGTIEARGADGTRYRLAIPRAALTAATTITITPLSKLTGLPDGAEKTLGVRIEPSGLVLAEPATLTITPAGGVPRGRTPWHFVFDRTGEDFTPVLPGAFDGTLVVKVTHFSGAGVVMVDPQGPFSLFFEPRNPLRHYARIKKQTVKDFYKYWNFAEHFGATRPSIAELEKILAATIFRTGINSRGNCDDVRAGYKTVLDLIDDFRRLRGPNSLKLGLFYTNPSVVDRLAWPGLPPAGLWNEDRNQAAAKLADCIQEAVRQCRANGDIRELVKSWIVVRRMRDLGGYEDHVLFATHYDMFEKGLQQMETCAQFELKIEGDGTRADERTNYLSSKRWRYQTNITLRARLDGSIPVLIGKGAKPMQYDRFACEYVCDNCAGCTVNGVGDSDPVQAELDWGIDQPAGGEYESWCAMAETRDFTGTPTVDQTPTIDRTPARDGWEKRCYAVKRAEPVPPGQLKLRVGIEPVVAKAIYKFANGRQSPESPPIGPGANWRWTFPKIYRDSYLLLEDLNVRADGSGYEAKLTGRGKSGNTTHTEALEIDLLLRRR